MITNHFFNLIQCYSEQGRCNFNMNFDFNPMLLPVFYIGILLLAILGVYLAYNTWRCCDD